MLKPSDLRKAFAEAAPDAPDSNKELFTARMDWVEAAIAELGLKNGDDCPPETLNALIKASIRIVGIDDVLEDAPWADEEPAPKPKRPRVQTPKDRGPDGGRYPRGYKPKRVIHADAEPTEKQIEMLRKLAEQKGTKSFVAACAVAGIRNGRHSMQYVSTWTRLQASQVIKELLASP